MVSWIHWELTTVQGRYNAVQFITISLAELRWQQQTVIQTLNSQQTSHSSPMSFWENWPDRVITTPHCILPQQNMAHPQNGVCNKPAMIRMKSTTVCWSSAHTISYWWRELYTMTSEQTGLLETNDVFKQISWKDICIPTLISRMFVQFSLIKLSKHRYKY